MFLHEMVLVEVPAAAARRRLVDFLDAPAGGEAVREAVAAGRLLLGGVRSVGVLVAAGVERMPVRPRGSGVVVPVRWWAGGPGVVISTVLDADIEVEPVSEGVTRISLVGSYRPSLVAPDGPAGRSMAARVTDAVAGEFLKRLVERLVSPESASDQ